MSVQKYRVKKGEGHTCISNRVIEILKNHIEALGLFTYLSSLPPEWEFHKTQLRQTIKVGVNKLDALLALFSKLKLIEIKPIRDSKGRFVFFDMHIFDEPASTTMETIGMETIGMENSTYKRNIEKRNKEEIKNSSSSVDEGVGNEDSLFNLFWEAYPKKTGKKAALKSWKRNKLDEKAEIIIADVNQRKSQNWQGKEKQYIPDPSTYLNGERWADELYSTKEITNGTKQTKSQASFAILTSIHARELEKERAASRESPTKDLDYDPLCPFSVHMA